MEDIMLFILRIDDASLWELTGVDYPSDDLCEQELANVLAEAGLVVDQIDIKNGE
jgi:hypothetical protein